LTRSAITPKQNLQWLYVTTATDADAQKLARTLVQERLVACANILGPVQSMFWWEGQVQEESEIAIVFKTQTERVDQLISRIKTLHSYECPCVVALDVKNGNQQYLNWIIKETT